MQIHVWEGTVFICFLKMMMKRLATLLLSLLLLAVEGISFSLEASNSSRIHIGTLESDAKNNTTRGMHASGEETKIQFVHGYCDAK
jgi:hypothetical protein